MSGNYSLAMRYAIASGLLFLAMSLHSPANAADAGFTVVLAIVVAALIGMALLALLLVEKPAQRQLRKWMGA